MIELNFVPEGRAEAVTAVDSVDAGSIPNLAIGSQITIEYSAARPRAAKVDGGTRACEWKNNLEVFGPVAAFACLALVLSTGRRRQF